MFEANEIRSWRAYMYGIGEGKLQRHSNSETVASDSMKLDVLQPFTSRQSSGTVSVGARAKSSADIFPCDEPSCVLTFSTEEAIEQYMTLGRHKRELERERERLHMTEYAGLGPIESWSLDHQQAM